MASDIDVCLELRRVVRGSLGAGTTIEVTATSADGSIAAKTFSIAINDVNEFAVSTPLDTNLAANAVDENVAAGTVVGITAFASDRSEEIRVGNECRSRRSPDL